MPPFAAPTAVRVLGSLTRPGKLAYPDLVSVLGNPKPIEEIRQRIVPLAQGKKRNLVVGIHIEL
jgi:hypothetical protein